MLEIAVIDTDKKLPVIDDRRGILMRAKLDLPQQILCVERIGKCYNFSRTGKTKTTR